MHVLSTQLLLEQCSMLLTNCVFLQERYCFWE
jgi:hypothetical protein